MHLTMMFIKYVSMYNSKVLTQLNLISQDFDHIVKMKYNSMDLTFRVTIYLFKMQIWILNIKNLDF